MQKLQDSVFSIVKTTNLSQSVFSFLLPNDEETDKIPQGGILNDTKHGWLALGSKFCVIDLRTGLKIAARTFAPFSVTISTVIELSSPLTTNSQQLIISLECEDSTGLICVFHINGSQLLRCIQTETVATQLAVCDGIPAGPFACFDGMVMAGTKHGGIFVFDLNRTALMQALKDISDGNEHLVKGDTNAANLTFLPLNLIEEIEQQRDLVLENDDHIALLLNNNSMIDGQYIYRNPDGTVRMKAKRDHVRVTVLEYFPQLGSVAVGFNFGAFQIWNLMNVDLEFTSQVNVECLPVTHFGFQEPCDDPRAFCYLWVIFSVTDRLEEEGFPLAVMYSLTYLGKRMLSDTKCLYQEFSMATIRYQMELSPLADANHFIGGRCISCHTYSVDSSLGEEGEESLLNLCQMVWECWGENPNAPPHYGMLLFDLDQWYKDQMPATYQLQTNAFMSVTWCSQLSRTAANVLDLRLSVATLSAYWHAARHDPHLFPNSLHYECQCLNTSEICTLLTTGIQRQIITSIDEVGPTIMLNPTRLYHSCVTAGLTPLYMNPHERSSDQEEQRRYLLSVALEAKLSRFLKRCAHDWATGSHNGVGCTLSFLIDWCWRRALELKENAKELSSPLFISSALPDRNVVRCLDHCVQQLSQLTGLLDAVLTTCCNLIVPDALSEIEDKYKGVGTVTLYFQVVQWFLRVGLLPERREGRMALPYPSKQLYDIYTNRRLKLQRLQEQSPQKDQTSSKSCSLLYIDQLIEHEFGGDRIHQMWIRGGSESDGLYPPPSLYSLLRLYLLPDIAEEHKHSLVLYLLVDYSMVYDDVCFEAVIRRVMQFPTMFGLSTAGIKATQALWHLDHRDFDFALDQLQCLAGNALAPWQHHVVLSSLLAQNKTQSALQYLHVRKPAPHNPPNSLTNQLTARNNPPNKLPDQSGYRGSDADQLDDWRTCCELYLARGLVFEALDVVRGAGSGEGLEHFFKSCRNSGHLPKLLQVLFTPFEENAFINYLKECNSTHTSDILVMYYLQQGRYIEAEQHNNMIRQLRPKLKETISTSVESELDYYSKENTIDVLVDMVCSSIPPVARSVAKYVYDETPPPPHVLAAKPMSVYVQAKSPKNTFTYKSTFIQDSIENASETWINKPKMRKGIKRALNIEDTPFICTPKLTRSRSIFTASDTSPTPSKRAKLDFNACTRTPKVANLNMSSQLKEILDMPEVQSPELMGRTGAGTPHSILKIRRNEALGRYIPSPVDSRYLDVSDDELLETASNHTHYSDKHLRFTIPTASEAGSTPSPPTIADGKKEIEIQTDEGGKEIEIQTEAGEKEMDTSAESFFTTTSHPMTEPHPMESPPKKLATEDNIKSRKSYKDTVRARRSLSISANSSLSSDPNTSIESIADIPYTIINTKYNKRNTPERSVEARRIDNVGAREMDTMCTVERERQIDVGEREKTPRGRRGIRSVGESTPLQNRSRSVTPERYDSPTITPLRITRNTRGRSRTPELSPLAAILEHRQEAEVEPHAASSLLSATRQIRSRSRTPERLDKSVKESPKLEAISESPVKAVEETPASPSRRSLRSRSRTPEVEKVDESKIEPPRSPRTLRSRAKTPEKIMSPKLEQSTKTKKSLSRIVLEANAFAKTKNLEKELESSDDQSEKNIECTPMKTLKQVPSLMDVTISPIVNKTLLQSSVESVTDKDSKTDDVNTTNKSLPPFTLNDTYFDKSVLHSYQSSVADSPQNVDEPKDSQANDSVAVLNVKSIPAFNTINVTDFDKSVLHSYESSAAETSISIQEETHKVTQTTEEKVTKTYSMFKSIQTSNLRKSVLGSCNTSAAESSRELSKAKEMSSLMTSDSDIDMEADRTKAETEAANVQIEKRKLVELEREINEIEGDLSHDSEHDDESDSSDEEIVPPGEGDDVEESSSTTSEEESPEDDDEEVISIGDSESDSSSKLHIDEQSSDTRATTDTVTQSTDNYDENVGNKRKVNVEVSIGQVSLLTDDNSGLSDTSDVNLNYSDEKKKNVRVTVEATRDGEPPSNVNVVVEIVVTKDKNVDETSCETQTESTTSQMSTDTKTTKTSETDQKSTETQPNPTVDITEVQKEVPIVIEEPASKEIATEPVQIAEETEKPKTRKRANSTSSNKSIQEVKETVETPEPKTPMTRKRSQSITSNKSTSEDKAEETTPENVKEMSIDGTTPSSRRRAKTPTSTEVRRILTRRASKELEKGDDVRSLDDSISTTPTRRSARTRSKDDASVASEGSVRSTRSKTSEDPTDSQIKPAPIRKGRKSTIVTKPDLSVIPENTIEERDDSKSIMNELTSSRRLTRNQKAVLESWLEPKPSPSRRRASTASRNSAVSELSHEDEESEQAFDVQPIDRISLLSKKDFEGSPDREERPISPDSVTSENTRQRRSRMTRAASEAKSTPKAAAKVARRVSVDIVNTSVQSVESPGRSRRASFTRACSALHTPKKTAGDSKKEESDTASPSTSEVLTPSRRGRKASTASNASQTKETTTKRSKKTSEETKEKKK